MLRKGDDHWEVHCEIFLAGSNHNSLRVNTKHPQVYKVVIEPRDQAQKVIESIPLPPASLAQSHKSGCFLVLLIGVILVLILAAV